MSDLVTIMYTPDGGVPTMWRRNLPRESAEAELVACLDATGAAVAWVADATGAVVDRLGAPKP